MAPPKLLVLAITAPAAGLAAALPAAAGTIAYSSLGTHSHVAVMAGDGSNKEMLTSGPVTDVRPAFSPAGTRLVFVRRRSDGSDDLYLVRADGTGVRRLTSTSAAEGDAAWSPLGRRIAFESRAAGGRSEIAVVEADGSGRRRLTDNTVDDLGPTWAPNGKRIAFTRWRGGTNAEIYSVGAGGNRLRRLTRSPADDEHPAWSSRGRIAFVRSRARGYELVVMDGDGSGKRRLLSSNRPLGAPVWSPGGRHIAFDLWDGSDSELFVIAADGTGLRRLTRNEADDYGPVWSPNGRRIAYTRVGSGNDVWSTRRDGGGKLRLAASARHEAVGDWSR